MINIQNEWLSVDILEQGAELDHIHHKKNRIDYLWGADPAWAKKSPVLFPIVGALKNNQYFFEGMPYELGRHGFARESLFKVISQSESTAVFLLMQDEQTLEKYPFDFEFTVHYSLDENALDVSYEVKNTDTKTMYFSVGGHPAFRVPLNGSENYDDYYLEFAAVEDAQRWPVTKDGLIDAPPIPLLNHTRQLPLKKELFYEDALVFKDLISHSVTLKSDRSEHGVIFNFAGFPYLGVWAAKNADFVCIEPWCGIADSVSASQQLTEKEGINKLNSGETFQRSWSVTMF